MLGLLSFLPSTELLAQHFFVLAGIFAFYKQYKKGHAESPFVIGLFIISTIIVLSSINILIHNTIFVKEIDILGKSKLSFIPYSIFIIFSFLIANNLNQKDLKIILFLILFEIIIGVIEFSIQKRSVLPWVTINEESPFGKNGLLYYSRVYGLSSNSSVFSYKILIGLIITFFINLSLNKRRLVVFVIVIGLIITFNRTIISCALLFLLLHYSFPFFLNIIRRGKIKTSYFITALAFLATITIVSIELGPSLLKQLNRGMDTTDTSGRLEIWSRYANYISENILFGNASIKKWMEFNDKVFHGHNVIIQTLATNGIIITLFYLFLLLYNLNTRILVFLIPLFITGITQYTYLWGISFVDIFIYFFILNARMVNYDLKWIRKN